MTTREPSFGLLVQSFVGHKPERYVPDLPPYTGEVTSYIVASSPRSGSNLLCSLMAKTGRLGLPLEYFQVGYLLLSATKWGTTSLAEYWQEVVRRRSTPNGVFGINLHFTQLSQLVSRGLVVDPTAWILVERQNLLAQGISFARASQTQIWNSLNTQAIEPIYEFERIRISMSHIRAEIANWKTYFERREISPLRIKYEDLIVDLDRSVKRILDLLMVTDDEPFDFPVPTLERQGDHLNAEWIERYKADCAALGVDPEAP